jgi:hypothetical protein
VGGIVFSAIFLNKHMENEQKNQHKENDPSKPMDSRKEVEQSRDPKTDTDFPGYPHYPAKEDIMNPDTGLEKVPGDAGDVENLTRSGEYLRKKSDEEFSKNSDRDQEAATGQE